VQTVSPEVLLNYEMGRASRAEPGQPAIKNSVQGCFPDSNRRVRPNPINIYVCWNLGGVHHTHISEVSGVPRTELPGSEIDVDGPDFCLWVAFRERVGDRSVTASDIDQDSVPSCWCRSVQKEQLGSEVDLVCAEHATIGYKVGSEIGQRQTDRSLRGCNGRFGIKILRHRARTVAFRAMSSPYEIRLFGDPVLRTVAADVADIDAKLARLADDMLVTMYDEPGLGLAAPQVGVSKRFFVYDIGEGPQAIVNPVISESRDEWLYEEGCLSVPGLSWDIVRPKEIHLTGYDLDGNEVSIEADELLSRLFQHELDHLDGVLLIDRLDPKTRKKAMKTLREQFLKLDEPERDRPLGGGLVLP